MAREAETTACGPSQRRFAAGSREKLSESSFKGDGFGLVTKAVPRKGGWGTRRHPDLGLWLWTPGLGY